jgi:predicted anti-sigma-YlaC factor YlaD
MDILFSISAASGQPHRLARVLSIIPGPRQAGLCDAHIINREDLMQRSRFNLWSAAISLAGALLWLGMGQAVSGLIWLVASLAWLISAMIQYRSAAHEPRAAKGLLRRFSRLLLWS